jgi:large subunit ribosomal protein L28
MALPKEKSHLTGAQRSPVHQNRESRSMSQVCFVCGKHPSAGRNVSHSHRVTNRWIRPNIQRVHAVINGSVRPVNVCTKCLKAGKVVRG